MLELAFFGRLIVRVVQAEKSYAGPNYQLYSEVQSISKPITLGQTYNLKFLESVS